MRKIALLLVILGACGDEGGAVDATTSDTSAPSDTSAGSDVGSDADIDATPDPFDPDEVIEVAITLPASDWDALRLKQRDPLWILGADCLDAPVPSPFPWYSASVSIDGETFADVGVRKKGNLTAYETERPPLRLDFDRNVAGREWRGQDDLVLNRAVQDPSFVRTCLAYELYAAAGEPAPRCGFAHVTVNGADLGLYVHVERMDKDFVERHFADASGNLYEGTLSDFRPGWVGSFERDAGDGPRTDLDALVTALEQPDDQLVAAVGAALDLDHFMTYWAMEALIDHVDGYSGNLNNFYVYDDPSANKLRFLVYGADFVLLSQVDAQFTVPPVMGAGFVARRLYAHPTTRATYLAKVKSLSDSLFGSAGVASLLAQIDRLVAVITPYVDDVASMQMELDYVKASIRGRHAAVQRGLETAPTEVPEGLRDVPCLAEIGSVSATFSTTMGSFEVGDPFVVGDGSMTLTLGDETLTFTEVGVTAGRPGPGIPVAALQMVALAADGRRFVAFVQVSTRDLVDDASVPLLMNEASVILSEDIDGLETPVGQVVPGTITFSDASANDGASIIGTFSGTVVEPY